jgi:L-threonylcarbamoyladenylate synthase
VDRVLEGGISKVGIESTIIDCTGEIPIILRPGAITYKMITALLLCEVRQELLSSNNLKAPGMLQSHYKPNANVFLSGEVKFGDGFIALDTQATPVGAIRLASPKNNSEFAQILYKALRLADSKKIENVFVVVPPGDDIAIAIQDRLQKSSTKINK